MPYFKSFDYLPLSIQGPLFLVSIPIFNYLYDVLLFQYSISATWLMLGLLTILSIVIYTGIWSKDADVDWRQAMSGYLNCLFSALLFSLVNMFMRIGSTYADDIYVNFFWERLWSLVTGLVLLVIFSYRKSFIALMKTSKWNLAINGVNEALTAWGIFLWILAIWFAPWLFLYSAASNTIQPIFVFILSMLGGYFFPRYFKEEMEVSVIIKKASVLIMTIVLLYFFLSVK